MSKRIGPEEEDVDTFDTFDSVDLEFDVDDGWEEVERPDTIPCPPPSTDDPVTFDLIAPELEDER